MSKIFDDFKDYVAYVLSGLGITLNWGSLNALIIFIFTVIYLAYQSLHKKSQKKVQELEAEKLKIEIEILKQNKI